MSDTTLAIKRLRRMITHLEQVVADLEAQQQPRSGLPTWNCRDKAESIELNRLLKIDLGAGLPNAALAEKYGVPRSYVSRIKRQLRRASMSACLCVWTFGRDCRLAVEHWSDLPGALLLLPGQLATFI